MCGLAGIVSFRKTSEEPAVLDIAELTRRIDAVAACGLDAVLKEEGDLKARHLGGSAEIAALYTDVRRLRADRPFFEIYADKDVQDRLADISGAIRRLIEQEETAFSDRAGRLSSGEVETLSRNIEGLKDIGWCLRKEIGENITRIQALCQREAVAFPAFCIFKKINAVLNSIDRLEVRGRDSAGVSLMFVMSRGAYQDLRDTLDKANFMDELRRRSEKDVLLNRGVSIFEGREGTADDFAALTFTYKIAAEIGALGDNVGFLRREIAEDHIFQTAANFSHDFYTVSSHTRWASVGAISEPNCHPVDNRAEGACAAENGTIHVCLNGDIDNFQSLKERLEKDGRRIHPDVTTDTKIIPMLIEDFHCRGYDIEESFRLAVNSFEGSHAISMQSDLAPGKIFLAQKGSGQAVFIGLAEDHYMLASELYGLIEETQDFLKLDGESVAKGKDGATQGQIFILSQESDGGLGGVRAMYYDGTPVALGPESVKRSEITSRDIDRQDFPHYFLKEVSESPASVEKTLLNRWKIRDGAEADGGPRYVIALDETVIPETLVRALREDRIRRVFFMGQGTAGVAAQACANILDHYMNDPAVLIRSLKSSELSGFILDASDDATRMADALVVAISQSGTTTDTNRAVDMVRERGAHTLAIVNRRDSDITFKVDGVMYTSSGRDIEMSVASTKAFYSQIVAGAVLGLHMAGVRGNRTPDFIDREIRQLLKLPDQMRRILTLRKQIEDSARRTALTRTYWAAVGSGPNKTSADEIRIKLSELCYKTISTDYVEDKKHIDLSSEPLIIVCAAGSRSAVVGDIVKDTAIFHAHKALPIVITDEGERRFDPYAEDVFYVPVVQEHLAPILNTLVGHLWGYYAALAINEGSRFLFEFRDGMQKDLNAYAEDGLDVYEIILEKTFREKVARFYLELRKRVVEKRFPVTIGYEDSANLILLLKYLAGRLPVPDFELDFGVKGTAMNMIEAFMTYMSRAVNAMARPVDAIKHQAKTVTVGTSRISEKMEGILFDALADFNIKAAQLTASNIIVLRNLQHVVSEIKGATYYRIDGLNLLGEPTEESTIAVAERRGSCLDIETRVEKDKRLKGTKRIIVRQGNVYIGKGRRDGRSILIIPVISASPSISSRIEHLLLLHIGFRAEVALADKIKALGGKHEHIKNIVQENNIAWDDGYLNRVDIEELFGRSAEKIGEFIVEQLS